MFPKPTPLKKERAAKRRAEADVVRQVRAKALARDRRCRFPAVAGWEHDGPLELAHLGPYRKSKTGCKAPAERHPLHGVAMLCRAHHRAYDEHRLIVTVGDQWANGSMVWWTSEKTYLGVSEPRTITSISEYVRQNEE